MTIVKDVSIFQPSLDLDINSTNFCDNSIYIQDFLYHNFFALQNYIYDLNGTKKEEVIINYFKSLFFLSPFKSSYDPESQDLVLEFILLEDDLMFPNSFSTNKNEDDKKKMKNNFANFLLYFAYLFNDKYLTSFKIDDFFSECFFECVSYSNTQLKDSNEFKKEIISRIKSEIDFVQKSINNDSDFSTKVDQLKQFIYSEKEMKKDFFVFTVKFKNQSSFCENNFSFHQYNNLIVENLKFLNSQLRFTSYNFPSYSNILHRDTNSLKKVIEENLPFDSSLDNSYTEQVEELISNILQSIKVDTLPFVGKKMDVISIFNRYKIFTSNFIKHVRNNSDHLSYFFAFYILYDLNSKNEDLKTNNISRIVKKFLQKHKLFFNLDSKVISNMRSAISDNIINILENIPNDNYDNSYFFFQQLIFWFPLAMKNYLFLSSNSSFNYYSQINNLPNSSGLSVPEKNALKKSWWFSNLNIECNLNSYEEKKRIVFTNLRNGETLNLFYNFAKNEEVFITSKDIVKKSNFVVLNKNDVLYLYAFLKRKLIEKKKNILYSLEKYIVLDVLKGFELLPEDNFSQENRIPVYFIFPTNNQIGNKKNTSSFLANNSSILDTFSLLKHIELLNLDSLNLIEKEQSFKLSNFIRNITKFYISLKYTIHSNVSFPFINLSPFYPGTSLSLYPKEEKDFINYIKNYSSKKHKLEEYELEVKDFLVSYIKKHSCFYKEEKNSFNKNQVNEISKLILYSLILKPILDFGVDEAIEKLENLTLNIKEQLSYISNQNMDVIEESVLNIIGQDYKDKSVISFFLFFPEILDVLFKNFEITKLEVYLNKQSKFTFLVNIIKFYILILKTFVQKEVVMKVSLPNSYADMIFSKITEEIFTYDTLLGKKGRKFFVNSYCRFKHSTYMSSISNIEEEAHLNYRDNHFMYLFPSEYLSSSTYGGYDFHLPSLLICKILLTPSFSQEMLKNIYDNNIINLQQQQRILLFVSICKGMKYFENNNILSEDIKEYLPKNEEEKKQKIRDFRESRRSKTVSEDPIILAMKEFFDFINNLKELDDFPLPKIESLDYSTLTADINSKYMLADIFRLPVEEITRLSDLMLAGYFILIRSKTRKEKSCAIARISGCFLPSIFSIFNELAILKDEKDFFYPEKDLETEFNGFSGSNNFFQLGYENKFNFLQKKS